MTTSDTLDASIVAMSDPKALEQVQRQLEAYQPFLDRFEELCAANDPVAVDYVKDLCCFTCGILDLIGAEFDPALALVVLQRIGHRMAESPGKWVQYTAQVASAANANRARGRSSQD